MDVLWYLIPLALLLGLCGLGIFVWTIRSGQYNDLDGAAHRILIDDDDKPLPDSTTIREEK
ncbi:MAG: cbb3-type cytochrome oxidase assembly protein CcoS [Alphaproteobacteria bacterium]|nr:cbb3-type cytochrome oxidase assembly protein CcoS [Alphaproteobacteria bacterium]OIN86794.1 MAG: cytochrome oxidase maturation protein, cbb3-type [Alphaproteobacteria bacterium CG1_02_46_17]